MLQVGDKCKKISYFDLFDVGFLLFIVIIFVKSQNFLGSVDKGIYQYFMRGY